jgi:hypothetical protein
MFSHLGLLFFFLIQTSIYQFPTNGETNDQFLSVATPRRRTASVRSTTRYHAQSHRVTRMLILVSTCFLLLNAPAHICSISFELYTLKKSELIPNSNQTYIHLFNNSNETKLQDSNLFYSTISTTYKENSSKINIKFYQIFYIILIISKHIAYLSYSINFFLYSFCGMKFRGELIRFLTRCRIYQRHSQRSRIINAQHSF